MKYTIFTLFIISAVTAEELFCTPNTAFQQNCNTCVCSKDGKSAACTNMICPEEHGEKYCEPGSQFQLDDLSSCICSGNGMTAACTLGLQVYGKTRYLAKNSQYCTPGSTFSPDNCNSCLCSQDGAKAVCTLRMCPLEQPKQVCEPHKHFKSYCNTCFCDGNGSSYSCTRKYCDKNIWNEDGSMKVAVGKSARNKICESRKIFKEYCNTCRCSDDGLSAMCTRMWCDKDIWNKDGTTKISAEYGKAPICTPNSQFKEQCNTCFCSADGLLKSCTMMSCDAFDGEPKGEVCTPRSTFSPDNCNICKCDEFGTDYVCTYKMCPPMTQSFKSSETFVNAEN